MKQGLLLRTKLVVSTVLIPPVFSLVSAQTSWIVGNEWARMDGAAGNVTFQPLPTHPDVANTFQGAPVQFSSYMQLGPEGRPLFFIVDGDVFDGEGYLIAPHHVTAPVESYVRDNGLLFQGVGEVTVAPVPNRCGLWYVFHTRDPLGGGAGRQELSFAVLDMTMSSALFPNNPNRRGRIYDLELLVQNGFEPITNQLQGRFSLTYNNELPDAPGWPGFRNGLVQMEVVHNESTDKTFLLAQNGFHIGKYELLTDRIESLGAQSVPFPPGAEAKILRTKGEIEAVSNGAQIRVALAYNALVYVGGPEPYDWIHNLHLVTLDATTPALSASSAGALVLVGQTVGYPYHENGQGDEIAHPAVGGIEFSPNQRYTYFVKSTDASSGTIGPTEYMGYWDWQTSTLSYLPDLQLLPFVDSKLELGPTPNGSGTAIYAGGTAADGSALLGCLLNPDDPSTASWLTDAIDVVNSSVCHDDYLDWLGEIDLYHLLPKQCDADPSDQVLASAECCSTVHDMVSFAQVVIPSGNDTWSTTDNPFQDRQLIRISGELRFQEGAHITASGLQFLFGEDDALIIEEGAFFACNNCTFANACDAMWKGIRVEGDAAEPEQQDGHQGYLRLYNSTVQGALTGVWCAKEDQNGWPLPSKGGGVVRAHNTVFKDCRVGARADYYHRYDGNGVELPNLCYFADCTFETTENWFASDSPRSHLILNDVNGVPVMYCAFKNSDPEAFGLQQRGLGIFGFNAGFQCHGGSQYASNSFEGLRAGVVASVVDPARTYTIDGMGFVNNGQGVVDFGSTDARITNNQFMLLGGATPSDVASVGIQLFESERYTVERNTFTDQGTNVPTVGIWFSGPAFEDNQIYDNEFTDLSLGTLVEERQLGPGDPIIAPGLQLLCGDHTGNNADQVILENGYIAFQQGLPDDGSVTANNSYGVVNCASRSGPVSNTLVWAYSVYGLNVVYNYYGNANSPQMRPDCVEELNGDPLSSTGDWFYDLHFVEVATPFDQEAHCANGVLDLIDAHEIGDLAELALEHRQKQGELRNALAQYRMTMDQARTNDLRAMLEYQPWHASYLVRDTLLYHHPLSNSVMQSAIERDEPLDPWHLTQVLIQNSPLNNEVWTTIDNEDALPPYFYALLRQYDQGTGLKGALEQEVVLRQREKTRLQHLLLSAWAADSTMTDRQDSLLAIFELDSLGDGLRGRYLTHLHRGEFTEAAAMVSELEANSWTEDLTIWGKIYEGVEGDWNQTGAEDREDLLDLAFGHASSVGAVAWATLLQVGELDSIPYPEVPASLKNTWSRREQRNAISDVPRLIDVVPNPTSDRIAFVIPAGTSDGILEVHDAQGRLVHSFPIGGRKGMIESSVGDLEAGLYTVRLVLDGFNLGSSKFTVIR